MKLIDQVCTMYQGNRLKELGVTVSPIFSHFKTASHAGIALTDMYVRHIHILTGSGYWEDEIELIPAYSVAELATMLPDYYPSWRFKVNESSDDCKWVATIICGPKPPGIDDIHTAHEFDRFGKTQAEALATLLIALLETNVITADEVNKRLTCS